jgi:hypothetical protein
LGKKEMIPREKLPEDPLEWSDVKVSFAHLAPDSADSCPQTKEEILEYIARESADLDRTNEERLKFIRTAQVADARYWLWSYEEEDGEVCYVALRQKKGSEYLSLSSTSSLSVDRYLLAHYYDMVYWS